MEFPFIKYSGCGNDFLLLDNRRQVFSLLSPLDVFHMCHRQHGVGADGVVLLENSSTADFKMRIFNADGSEAEMCGNGLRCLMKFLLELGFPAQVYTIETQLFHHHGEFVNEEVLITLQPPSTIEKVTLKIGFLDLSIICLNTGVPHGVVFVDQLEKIDINQLGKTIRFHPRFAPQGLNVNFASILAKGELLVRTYERGVEGETLACGTGATATALAANFFYGWKSPVKVIPRSQEKLTVFFDKNEKIFTSLKLQGPARKIFEGIWKHPPFDLKNKKKFESDIE